MQQLAVTYAYDALNRPTDTTYSDGTTPKVSHRYDYASFLGQTFAYPIGREVAATTANNTIESFTSYDPMGRVASTTQCNPGVSGCKTFMVGNNSSVPGYDKLGNLLNLIYPGNGFTLTYGYDSAARLSSATDSNGVIYAQTPAYLPSGAIQEFASPNFNGNKYHVDYNSRLQPTEIWTGTSAGAGALFDKQYSYGAAGTNNGNIYTITNVKDTTRTQSFTYDPLNRLLTAGDQTHWSNSYVYDAWGNLYQKNPGTLPGEGMSKVPDTNNHLSGLTYDAAGNVQNDGGSRYAYDAENRIICTNPDVNFVCNTNSVIYTYDADGRRIQKSTGINYWYGPGGAVFAETDSAGNWTNYIFFGGQRLARNVPQTPPAQADIKYYITDHLHSTGMFVDQAGTTTAILDDNDFYPWGGVVPGVGKTTSNNTIKFTGQYRDTDTVANLDYFGARYYSNTIGRFMSPDWASAPTTVPYAKFGDPQSLNLYSYVDNGPINAIDVGGHYKLRCQVCRPKNDSGFGVGPTLVRAPGRPPDTRKGVNPAQTPSQFQIQVARGLFRAAQALDFFNNTLGLGGKSDCAKANGDCITAIGLAVTTVVAAVFSGGESEEAFVERQIATAGRKIENISAKILTEETLAMAKREIERGIYVLKSGGGEFDHVGKIEQGISGLERQIRHLEWVLDRKGLSESQISRIDGLINKAYDLLDVASEALNRGPN